MRVKAIQTLDQVQAFSMKYSSFRHLFSHTLNLTLWVADGIRRGFLFLSGKANYSIRPSLRG